MTRLFVALAILAAMTMPTLAAQHHQSGGGAQPQTGAHQGSGAQQAAPHVTVPGLRNEDRDRDRDRRGERRRGEERGPRFVVPGERRARCDDPRIRHTRYWFRYCYEHDY
jgi:hypothetical protein